MPRSAASAAPCNTVRGAPAFAAFERNECINETVGFERIGAGLCCTCSFQSSLRRLLANLVLFLYLCCKCDLPKIIGDGGGVTPSSPKERTHLLAANALSSLMQARAGMVSGFSYGEHFATAGLLGVAGPTWCCRY